MVRQGAPIRRVNMVIGGFDFSHVNQIGSYLFLTHRSSSFALMSRSLKAISSTRLVLCVDKRFVFFYSSR